MSRIGPMEKRRGSLRWRFARAADLLLLFLLSLAASTALSGGFRTSLWGGRMSVTSVTRLVLWIAGVFVARHLVLPRPSLLARVTNGLTRRRTAAAWLVAAVALCAVNVAVARLLGNTGRDRNHAVVSRRQRLFKELQPSRLANCQLERFGEPHDGGYLLCANLLGSAAAGYSYGIAGYDKWGCDVSHRRKITVHEYDCFDNRQPACPGGNTLFHEECVAGRRSVQNGRVFDTLANQIASNGDDGKHLVVKIDVEGAEWESLLNAPDRTLERIDQMVVEFHGVDDVLALAVVQRLKRFFYVGHLHFNNCSCTPDVAPFPARAYEVLFVSRRIGRLDYIAQLLTPLGLARPDASANRLDAANDPLVRDCQLR